MKTIRNNVFETNSSSCHSITILTDSEYEKFRNNELVYNTYYDQVISLKDYCINTIENLTDSLDNYVESLEKYDKVKHESWELSKEELQEKISNINNLKNLSDKQIDQVLEWLYNNIIDGQYPHGYSLEDFCGSYDVDIETTKDFNRTQIYLLDNLIGKSHLYTYDGFNDMDNYETYDVSREINGEKVHVIGYYGYN